MLLVNYLVGVFPDSEKLERSQLQHSPFPGVTFADLIFPIFLVIVGISTAISERRRVESGVTNIQSTKHALIRAGKLFLLGCFLLSVSYATPRFNMGTLQRIAVCYLIGYSVSRSSMRLQFALFFALIFGYHLASALIGAPGAGWNERWVPGHTLTDWVDTVILGKHRAEGILTTLCAAASSVFGVLIGTTYVNHTRWQTMVLWFSIGFALLGIFLSSALAPEILSSPLSQRYWTPSYAFFTTGISALVFVGFHQLSKNSRFLLLSEPFRLLGLNTIGVYVFANLVDQLLNRSGIRAREIQFAFDQFGAFGARYLYPSIILGLCFSLGKIFFKRRIFIRL